jgi:hypothetical protein
LETIDISISKTIPVHSAAEISQPDLQTAARALPNKHVLWLDVPTVQAAQVTIWA